MLRNVENFCQQAIGAIGSRIYPYIVPHRKPRRQKPHGLSGELIISLTSFPARYSTLHLTLTCLLTQSVRPDRVVLWLAAHQAGSLPDDIRNLPGLTVRSCADIRSYKKLVPSLQEWPDAWIATADDDLYFPPHWLAELVEGAGPGVVTAHRVHRLARDAAGRFRPYDERGNDVGDAASRRPSDDLLPTTGSGALYPPGSLHEMAFDVAQALATCPTGDDLWFAWSMWRRGTKARKVGGRFRLIEWHGTQAQSLWSENQLGLNDRMLEALEEYCPLQPRREAPSGRKKSTG